MLSPVPDGADPDGPFRHGWVDNLAVLGDLGIAPGHRTASSGPSRFHQVPPVLFVDGPGDLTRAHRLVVAAFGEQPDERPVEVGINGVGFCDHGSSPSLLCCLA